MSSRISSRWAVRISAPVADADRDEDHRLTDAAIERLFSTGRSAYFDGCATLDPSGVEVQSVTIGPGRTRVDGETVSVYVNVVELFPTRFEMAARIRPDHGNEIAADARCFVSPNGGMTPAMRDELIALARGAKYPG